MINRNIALAITLCLTLAACATTAAPTPQNTFFQRLTALCGLAFEGRIVTSDPADAMFAGERLTMHVRDCTTNETRIPFAIGANRSRTWVVTRTDAGLRLKHEHRHEDGTEDALSQYGGDTANPGSAERQEFPADDFSKRLFVQGNLPASIDNVWALELRPGEVFAYDLRRPNRHFRVEFDLTRPVAAPPAPWGSD